MVESRSVEIVFANNGASDRTVTVRVRIQSEAGVQNLGVIAIPYQKLTETAGFVYVRVRKPDSTTILTPPEEAQDVESELTRQAPTYSDSREKHLAVKGLGVGDLLEYQAHWQSQQPLVPGQFWTSYNFAQDGIILQDKFQVSVPRDRAIKWKSEKFQPVITEASSLRVFLWTHTQSARKPAEQEKKDQAVAAYQTALGKLPQPDIQLSSFTSWQELGDWYNTLQAERVKPTAEIRAKALELTKGLTQDDAKLRAIYRYVSINFRYVGIDFGIGRYQPHSAADVLSNLYGDCKDKHTLMASLLAAVDIPAYPALISSSRDIDAGVPSPAQFDHMLTVVPQGERLQWLDSTPEVAPFGYLFASLRGKRALVISGAKTSFLTLTPADPPVAPKTTFVIEAKLNDSGTLEGNVDRTVQGDDSEIILRYAFRRSPPQQWKDLVQQVSFASGFSGDVSAVTTSPAEKTDGPFRISYHYLRKDYPDFANRRISSPLPLLNLPAAPEENQEGDTPVWLGPASEILFESRVELPKGYRPGLPSKIDLVEKFAEFHVTYSFAGGVVTTQRHLVLKSDRVEPSEYPAYREFCQTVQDNQDLTFPITLGSSSITMYQEEIWTLPASHHADAAKSYEAARQKFEKGDIEGEIALVKHAVEIDPRYTRAWLWLGEIYKSRGQFDQAVDAYRAAVRVDPQQTVSYRALGSTLAALKKFDEAILVWKELLRISPGDPSGLFGLGTTLEDAKRCPEAAEVLEADAQANPQIAILQEALANSLLCAGQTERAVAAYRREVELDPSWSTYNSIAYDLAEHHQSLDLALQYATIAVQGAITDSQKIKLSSLVWDDRNNPIALASFWDTLGWVYFQTGKLALAKEYLVAAWELSQFAGVADHLGHVYEKEADLGSAVHFYRLAINQYRKGNGGADETSAHVERILPGSSQIDSTARAELASELSTMRNVKLKRLVPGTANAEVFVIVSRDPKTLSGRVEDIRFLSGEDELKGVAADIESARFPVSFPREGQPRVLRRAILNCSELAGCSLTFLNPEDVRSVN